MTNAATTDCSKSSRRAAEGPWHSVRLRRSCLGPDAVHGPGQDFRRVRCPGQIVYFCDIPLSGLELHMKKYGCFGIAFASRSLVTRGANPAFYVVKDSILR